MSLRWPVEQMAALQSKRLRVTVQRCLDRHPHYAPLLRDSGVRPAELVTPADLAALPLTAKSDFLAAPESFRLTPAPSEGSDVLWDVMYTTGSTTGQPAPVYASSLDHIAHLAAARREGSFIGLSNRDTIANLLPLTPFPMGAYARSASDAASVGAAMVWCHTGRSDDGERVHRSLDEAIDLVRTHRATVLWGIASFVRRFLLRCTERGVSLESVRMSLVTGEAVSASLKAELARLMLGAGAGEQQVVNRYGATELGTSLYECEPGSGLHLLTPEDVYLEVVDPVTERTLPDGEVGPLAFTHLNRTGTVFLRYLLGDITSLSHDPCPACGLNAPRLVTPPRRSAGLVKIKGTLVDLNGLHENLTTLQQVNEAQILVTRVSSADAFSPDVLEIRIAADVAAQVALSETVTALVTEVTLVRPKISFVSAGELFDPLTAPKAQYIVDRRGSDDAQPAHL